MAESGMERDGEALLRHLVPAAEARLRDEATEEIRPFAAVLGPGDRARPLEAGADAEAAEPEVAFEALCAAIRDRAAREPGLRAAGIAADVHVVRQDIDLHTDAIRFYLEVRDGGALNVFLPYGPDPEGRIVTGETWAIPAEPFLFPGLTL